MSGAPDGELLDRFRAGDDDAFETLFRQFQGEVYRWMIRIVREPSDAEDVVVEAFWRAFRGCARFDPTRSFGAWMRRIATNAALDHLRAARTRPISHHADDERLAAPSADSDVRESVTLAFAALSPKLRVVATLALIEQRPYADIAEALDVPINTVKTRLFRATRALRKELVRLGIRP